MHTLIQKYFGYHTFRPLQAEIISAFSQKKDCLVLMPTGGGKSVCFQIPALMMSGTMLVISPLIALMKDQVDTLNAMGIEAAFLNSSLSASEQAQVIETAKNETLKLLYIAPERLSVASFLQDLQSIPLSSIAIDEAHCISQWGHDFRPDYRNLQLLRTKFPSLPIIALTASATPKVQQDILDQLHLQNPEIFQSSFYRKNLSLQIVPKRNAFEKIVSRLHQFPDDSAIIYCFSRKETEELAEKLRAEKINADCYHAGLSVKKRSEVQEKFIKDEIPVMCATIAFGMGIDKPNVRTVFHTHFPKTLEGYYQEIGRAGRDGLHSECILLYSAGDFKKHEFFLNQQEDKILAENERKKIGEMMNFCESKKCRWKTLIDFFGEHDSSLSACGHCDLCEAKKDEFDATEVTQKILSCMIRTGQRFGKNHILKILRGSKEESILKFGHETLPVWNIEKQFSHAQLMEIFSYLEANGLVIKSIGEFPVFSVTAEGIDFLKTKKTLLLPKLHAEKSVTKTSLATDFSELSFSAEVFSALRVLRKTLADTHHVPPFVIFSDVSLQEMAAYLPQNSNEFSHISGVGEQKLAQWGEIFLQTIQEQTALHQLTPKSIPLKSATRKTKATLLMPSGNITQRMHLTKKLLQQKQSSEVIASQVGVSVGTIIGYFEKMQQQGEKLDFEYLLPDTKTQKHILQAFKDEGTITGLGHIFRVLQEKISYEDIRLMKIWLEKE